MPNGTRYLALLNEEKSLKFLTRSDLPLYYARLYRVVYVKANVGRDFLPSLAEARAALAE